MFIAIAAKAGGGTRGLSTRPRLLFALLACLSASGAAGDAAASGFALREQSATAIGNALAGSAAGADDVTYLFHNPAAMTRLTGSQLAAAAHVILPQSQFNDGQASTAAGVPLGGNDGGDDVAENAMLPTFFAMWDVSQGFALDRPVRLGMSVTTPFGLETRYRNGWLGRYHALDSRVQTVNLNPVAAVEVVPGLSLAAGAQFQYFDARLTNAIDFGSLGEAQGPPLSFLAEPGLQDGRSEIQGDDWGYGYNFGILYEPWTGTRFGATYRSKIEHDVRGRAKFKLDDAGIGSILQGGSGAFTNTGARTDVETPQSVSFGIHQDITPQWAVMATAEWTNWASFENLDIEFGNPAQPTSLTEEDWRNTWFWALGATWRPVDAWAVRTGVARDQGAARNRTRTPRVPDSDRTWLALGASYKPLPNLSIDASYAHVFVSDADIRLTADQPGNASRGNLSGQTESRVDIIALQARWTF
jgi:long-chain fatty acid transport protein